MCSAPIFVAKSEAPTIGHLSVRPARKKLLLSLWRRAQGEIKPEQNVEDQRPDTNNPIR
jgi:hypothetical protein